MNVQFVHAPVHNAEQVREIIREAAAIADEYDGAGLEHDTVFKEAARLLGARVSATLMEQPMPLGLPRMDMPRGRG